MNRQRQRGVALITALLIFALLAILGANLTWDNGLDVRRTMTALYHEEGAQAVLGAESWVLSLLRDDLQDSETDHLGELWAQEMPVLPIESDTIQGVLQGGLEDLQGRFNVNNLVDSEGKAVEEQIEQFQRLLLALGLDPRFAGIAADWIDADQEPLFPDGAEDSIYSGMVPSYRTPNMPITSPTELYALDGMNKATMDVLLPHITALPPLDSGEPTGINVNTATAAVLQSLDNAISAVDAERLLEERADGGFAEIENRFATLVEPEVLNTLVDTSSYFQLKVVVQIANVRITYFSILQRSADGSVAPILRSFGTI